MKWLYLFLSNNKNLGDRNSSHMTHSSVHGMLYETNTVCKLEIHQYDLKWFSSLEMQDVSVEYYNNICGFLLYLLKIFSCFWDVKLKVSNQRLVILQFGLLPPPLARPTSLVGCLARPKSALKYESCFIVSLQRQW